MLFASGLPKGLGDIYMEQDRMRDFARLWEGTGLLFQDLLETTSRIMYGGIVVQGSSGPTFISASGGVAYMPYSITLGIDTANPPTVAAQDLSAIRVNIPTATNLLLTGSAILDGSTVNYVKVTYAPAETFSRPKLKAAGSWYALQQDGTRLYVDQIPPTYYELSLATLVGDGSTFLNITQNYDSNESRVFGRTISLSNGSPYTLQPWQATLVLINTGASDYSITLPLSIYGMRIRIMKVDTGAGKVTIGTSGSEQINGVSGSSAWEITDLWGYVDLLVDITGGGWVVVGNRGTTYETVDATSWSQSSPAVVTWYNSGITLTVPPGTYRIRWRGTLWTNQASGSASGSAGTLSTSTSAETNEKFTSMGGGFGGMVTRVTGEDIVTLAVSTTFYLLAQCQYPVNLVGFMAGANKGVTVIEAERIG